MDKVQLGRMLLATSAFLNSHAIKGAEVTPSISANSEKIEYAKMLLESTCSEEPGFDLSSPAWQWDDFREQFLSEIISGLENNIKNYCKPYDLTTLTAFNILEPGEDNGGKDDTK